MPLILNCPATQTSIKLAGFGDSNTVLQVPHPLLSLTHKELAKVTTVSSEKDYHVLLCAWMEQLSRTGIAHWNGALNPRHFSVRWHEQQLENVTSIIQWIIHNCNHPALAVIPHIRLTPQLTCENVQTWVEECRTIVGSFDCIFETSERLKIRAQLEAAEKLLNDYAVDDSRLTGAARKLRSRKAYLLNSLSLHENQEAVALVMKVALAPQLYEVRTIQRIKEFCLDYCIETGVENYNDKQELIHILDAAMVDKLGMAAILGCIQPQEDKELLGTITAKYSIEIDGKTFLNGATPRVSQALQRNAAMAIADAPVKVYESEPVREAYKSQLGYNIAHKQWLEQNRTVA